ncbi:MAG: hypothetical protein J6J83_02155 [Oscillospiraceae bacterium]|nr:hypothetical protein [Oscillospiraceae bacterium]
MKKLYALVLTLVVVLSMVVTAHAAPDVEGTWIVNTATYTEAGAQYMNEIAPLGEGLSWVAGYPYPAAAGACYIFSGDQFSSTLPPNSSPITWLSDSSFQAGDAVWNVSVSGDTMVLTETVLGTAYSCTKYDDGTGGSGGGDEGGAGGGESSGGGAPNTADPFSLGLYTTMAVASLGGLLAMKKKSRG